MKRIRLSIVLVLCMCVLGSGAVYASSGEAAAKPPPDKILSWLTEGNTRFVQGKSVHPHADAKRIALADTENQGKYALATILSCSDSRVPPEIVFDAGVMDLFVIRVAGNVANTDETGTVEYGLCHVNTPVLVVLGHTQCGAVTAVAQEITGHGHPLERNIPPLVASIVPVIKQTMEQHPELKDNALVGAAIEANVWEVIKNIFLKSPATRDLVKKGQVTVVGAVYDMHTGGVNWLASDRVAAILREAEASPGRAQGALYEKEAPIEAKPAASKAPQPSEEQSLAPKVRELAAKVDAKTAEAASDLKEVKGKIDALAAQVKNLADTGRSSGGDAGSETVKALSADVKGLKSAVEARLASVESSAGSMFWLMVSLIAVCVLFFGWVLWKLGSLGAQHDQLRSKVRKAFERVNNDIKRHGD